MRVFAYMTGLLLICTACGSDADSDINPVVTYDMFGQPFEPAPALPVQSVLAESERHTGGPVMVEGVLYDECEASDCWMLMRSDTAQLLILPPDFEVPDAVAGRRAVVHGQMSSGAAHTLKPTGVMVEKVRS